MGQRARASRRPAALAAAATLALLGFANLSSAASFTIQAKNYQFVVPGGGSSLDVAIGSQVTWVASGDPHTVTSGAPGSIDDRFVDHPAGAGLLASGDTFSTTFTATGTYPYFCEIHPEQMSGVIKVIELATNPPTAVPTPSPTAVPTPSPTRAPSPPPTAVATGVPTPVPTRTPTAAPTSPPPAAPTGSPATPSSGAESGAPPSATPTPVASIEESSAPTPSGSAIARSDGASTTAGDGQATAIFVALGIVALAGLGALALRRRDRGNQGPG